MDLKKIMLLIVLVGVVIGLITVIVMSTLEPPEIDEVRVAELRNEFGNDFLDIREDMFITQIDDVYFNMRDYTGRGIMFEGFVISIEDRNELLFAVGRDAPGCCR